MSPKKKPLPEAISIRQTAQLLDVHHTTVRRWIRCGFILAYRVGPQLVRIPRTEIVRMRKVRMPTIESDQPIYPVV